MAKVSAGVESRSPGGLRPVVRYEFTARDRVRIVRKKETRTPSTARPTAPTLPPAMAVAAGAESASIGGTVGFDF
jgi:hypothetical protein